jgi:hypothetical protein
MKRFVTCLFVVFLSFSWLEILAAQQDVFNDDVKKAQIEAEAKLLKKQALEASETAREEGEKIKKKAIEDENRAKKEAYEWQERVASERKVVEAKASELYDNAKSMEDSARLKEEIELKKIEAFLRDASQTRYAKEQKAAEELERIKKMRKEAIDDENVAKANALSRRENIIAERKAAESEANALRDKAKHMADAAKLKEKYGFEQIDIALKKAAKERYEAEKWAEVYHRNAMLNPEAKNRKAEELLRSINR